MPVTCSPLAKFFDLLGESQTMTFFSYFLDNHLEWGYHGDQNNDDMVGGFKYVVCLCSAIGSWDDGMMGSWSQGAWRTKCKEGLE
jgi:hypothetical protein